MPLFMSDKEFSRCSGGTTAVAAKAEASDINAKHICSHMEQKYLSLAAEFSKLELQVSKRLRVLSESKQQNYQIHLQPDREIENLRTEMCELHKSERQLIGLNEHEDLVLFLSEFEAELGLCRAAFTRLEQEKEIVDWNNAWFDEQLNIKVNTKHTELDADMSYKLADVETQFGECSKSIQQNKDRVRRPEMLKSMPEELISAKDAAAAYEERSFAELSIEAADLKEKLEKCEAEIETRKNSNELSHLSLSSLASEPIIGFSSKLHTEEAASKVAAVLRRAEEEGHMIESLHTSHEKGVISNAEKRASDVVCSLCERVQRLHVSLATIQSVEEVREEARAMEMVKHEDYVKKLERELDEAKKELRERENKFNLTHFKYKFAEYIAHDAQKKLSSLEKEMDSVVQKKLSSLFQKEMDSMVCPICLTSRMDMAFGCGHMTCKECGSRPELTNCPICRAKITSRLRVFRG